MFVGNYFYIVMSEFKKILLNFFFWTRNTGYSHGKKKSICSLTTFILHHLKTKRGLEDNYSKYAIRIFTKVDTERISHHLHLCLREGQGDGNYQNASKGKK